MSSNDIAWKEMIEGNKDAFFHIYGQNYKYLFSYGFSICADKELTKDCIQSLFLEIWDRKNTNTKEVQNVRSYLCTWLRRKISNELNKEARKNIPEGYASSLEPSQKSYEELLVAFQESEEQKEKLRNALSNLTKKQLEIIRMKFFENLSYDDISQKTSLSTRTVYNVVYEAITRLREFMSVFFF